MRRRTAWAWAAVLPCLLAACTVGPDFHPPAVQAPASWGRERDDVPSRTIAKDVDPAWWNSFHDAELSSLVRRLAAQNLDLKAAADRIGESRAARQLAASQGLPHVDAKSSYTRNRQSANGFLRLVEPQPGAPAEYDIWQNGLTASWELDLFGRVRRGVEAANAELQATLENRRGLALEAVSELAQDYLQLRGVQARLGIARRNLALAETNAALVRDRFGNGVATTLETAQASAQRDTIAAEVPPLRTREAALINAIGLLLAEAPRALQAELQAPSQEVLVPPLVPVGVPAGLVRRRPDVLEAEARLHEATARTGVAVADFYPDITLNGSANLDGLQLADAFSLPSRAFQVGPEISLPIFRGGQLRGQLHLRQAQQREAAINFEKTVLQAWSDVDNALTGFAEAQKREQDIAASVGENAVALHAARQRYAQGAADFLNVVSTQADLLRAEDDLAASRTEVETDLVALYRALGGGWPMGGS